MWSNLSQLSKKGLSPLQSLFVFSLLSIVIWLVAVDMAQYLLTEHWYVFDHLNSTYTTLGLIGLIVFTALIARKNLKLLHAALIIGIFFLVLIGHINYSRFYEELQQIPKIKSVSKNWTIQGDRIQITGRNFGSPSQPGKVMVGKLTFQNIYWDEYKVVVEQPVPEIFFSDNLLLCNSLLLCIDTGLFEVRDPRTVK